MASAATQIKSSKAIEYVIDIVDVCKSFTRRSLRKSDYTTIKSALLQFFVPGSRSGPVYTHVLRDLRLRIPKGSSVGVIGRNGSGKSTLLKLISGIYRPDKGHINVNGRIAAMIELGAGFHPDFSGRENLMLAGAMYGLSQKEIESRFQTIVDFAELNDVIDDPVRTYSSGMYMRLGFSLAVHVDPDILIIDEVLAVGDAAFIHKCKDKIAELRRAGKTLLLVSHDLESVERWCDEVLWLQDGEVRERGEPRRVIDAYLQFIEKGEEIELRELSKKAEKNLTEANQATAEKSRWGSREIEITGVRLRDRNKEVRLLFHCEDSLRVEIDYQVNEELNEIVFGVGINRLDGLVLHGTNTSIDRVKVPQLKGKGTVMFDIKRLGLPDGTYTLDLAVHREDGYPFDYHKNAVQFSVRWPYNQSGVYVPEHEWKI